MHAHVKYKVNTTGKSNKSVWNTGFFYWEPISIKKEKERTKNSKHSKSSYDWHIKYERTIVKRKKLRCDGCILTEFQWNYGLRSLQRHGWNNVRFTLRKFTVAFLLGYSDNETGNDLTKSKAASVKQIQLFKEQNWRLRIELSWWNSCALSTTLSSSTGTG